MGHTAQKHSPSMYRDLKKKIANKPKSLYERMKVGAGHVKSLAKRAKDAQRKPSRSR